MQRALPHPLLDRLTLLLVIALIVVPITYLQIKQPSWESVLNALNVKQEPKVTEAISTPTVAPKPAAVAPPPAAAPAAAPPAAAPVAPAPAVKTATTNSFVHFRAGKSTTTPIIADLEAGTTIQLRDDSDATWQGVTYNGQNGYIYRTYIQY